MKTYVNEDNLRAFFPRISDYLGNQRVDFSFQIQEGFRQTLDALRARGIKVRQIGTPLDLFRPAGTSTTQHILTAKTIAASEDESYVEGLDGYNRLVLAVSSIKLSAGNESYIFELQGSQDLSVDTSNPPANWSSILKLVPKGSGDLSATFSDEFRYYRLRSTLAGTGPTITLQASLLETSLDRLVSYKALQLIMTGFARQDGDIFTKRAAEMASAFENGIAAVEVQVDSQEDNVPSEEEREQAGGPLFWR